MKAKYGFVTEDALREIGLHHSAEDIDIVRMVDEIQITRERVAELRAWATNRIAWCRAMNINGTSDMYTATQVEQRALEAVLRILDDKETP